MNSRIWLIFCIISLLSALNVGAISGVYDITVAENGNSFVVLSLTGNGTVNVPLPLDVESLNVENALYIQTENGIDILLADDSAVVIYTSSILTSKTRDEWNFEMELPNLDSAAVTVSFPKNVMVSRTSLGGMIKNLENSIDVSWELENFGESKNVFVYYKFSGIAVKTTTSSKTTTPEEKIEEKENPSAYLLFAVILLMLLFIAYFFMSKKNEKKESKRKDEIVLSKEKRNVMKTLSGNEIKIINVLLENKGKMLRNDLEKISGIPKSSLSVAIGNLERKNVIQVDKSEWTHEVELTEWFKSL